jgi:hypothetical protein
VFFTLVPQYLLVLNVELDTAIDKSSSTIATPKQILYPSPG